MGLMSGENTRGYDMQRLHKKRRSSPCQFMGQSQPFYLANFAFSKVLLRKKTLVYLGFDYTPCRALTIMARKYLGGSGERLTVWISIAASTVLVFYGYDQGVFGNVIINENFLHTFGYPSANMQGVMTSIYNIGCFIGAMSTIWTGDKLGRPRQIMLGSTVIGIGAIIQTCSWTVASMMVGRIVAGLGTGMNTATAGVWQAETSKMNSRGKLVIIQMGRSRFLT
jgi:MFS family permease